MASPGAGRMLSSHDDAVDPHSTNGPASTQHDERRSSSSTSTTAASTSSNDEHDSAPNHRITLDPGHATEASPQAGTETETHHTASGDPLPAVVIPPYWQSHTRTTSSASGYSLAAAIGGANGSGSHGGHGGTKPAPIRMEDNTADEEMNGVKSPLWARAVTIDSHTVVSGNSTGVGLGLGMGMGVGDYVVWTCRVRMIDGGSVQLHKRYSEFEALRSELESTFPRAGSSLPVLPAKSVFYRFRPAFLEKRRAGLEYFLNCVLLNPQFASSAVLKEFVFS